MITRPPRSSKTCSHRDEYRGDRLAGPGRGENDRQPLPGCVVGRFCVCGTGESDLIRASCLPSLVCKNQRDPGSGRAGSRSCLGSALGAYPGSEVVGVVGEISPSESETATASQGARAGQLVLVPRLLPCGECRPCRRGRVSICSQVAASAATTSDRARPAALPGPARAALCQHRS